MGARDDVGTDSSRPHAGRYSTIYGRDESVPTSSRAWEKGAGKLRKYDEGMIY